MAFGTEALVVHVTVINRIQTYQTDCRGNIGNIMFGKVIRSYVVCWGIDEWASCVLFTWNMDA